MIIKYGKQKCPYCGQAFKRITANHLKKHNITWEQYLKEYKDDEYIDKLIEEFINNYYITVRSKYLIYKYREKKPITCKANDKIQKLHMGIIKQHRSHTQTLGIFFPTIGSKIIGLDLDVLDEELLNKIYSTITEFIEDTSILVSFSGNKGYHIDIFLNDIVNRDVIRKFYNVILKEVNTTENILELRGASNQGYKLPFGIHQGTQEYCYACTEFGIEIKDKDLENIIKTRTKANIKQLEDAIQKYWSIEGDLSNGPLTTQDVVAFEEIKESVKPLENYSNLNKDFIEDLVKIYREGFNGPGLRNKYTLKIALFLKSHMCLNEKDTLIEMLEWSKRCKGYRANTQEFKRDIENTIKRVFEQDMKLIVAAKEIKISKVEIKEILSVITNNKLQTKALRQLYYLFLLHSKAYSNADGIFFFTLEQMQKMGATNNKTRLLQQISKLIELKKVYKYTIKKISRVKNAPAEYKLNYLSEIIININNNERSFELCSDIGKCKDCLEYATCYFIRNNNELKKYYNGRKKECPYNKF